MLPRSSPGRKWKNTVSSTYENVSIRRSQDHLRLWAQRARRENARPLPRNRHQRRDGRGNVACYNCKAKYGGLSASDLERLKDLEAENTRLKKMYADLSLVHDAQKDAAGKSSKPG
jgi:putative transposase